MDEIMKLSEEDLEEYRDMFQDINEPLDALFKALKRIVIDPKQEIKNNEN